MAERKKVIIKSPVTERQFTINDKQLTSYEFKALIEGEESPVKFETMFKALADAAPLESERELEFTVTTKGDFIHRKVSQVYKDGVAIYQPKSQQGYGYRGKAPEEIASIESQKRADIINQGWIAGKYPDDHPLVQKMQAWLGKFSEAVASQSKLGSNSEQIKDTATVTESSERSEYPTNPKDIQTVGDLMNALMKDAGDKKLTKETVVKVIKSNVPLDELRQEQLPEAYRCFWDWSKGERKEQL